MLSIRKKIALSAGLAVAASGFVVAVQATSPATSVPAQPAHRAAQQKATIALSIVPGIIGPGGSLQKSKDAKWAVIAKYGAGKAGQKVKLQKKSGGSWVTKAKGTIDKKGFALFAVPPASPSAVSTYRIDGPGVPTASQRTDIWGSPEDFVDEFGGTSLNLDNWSHRGTDYSPASKRECSKADPKAVKVKDGTARLSVMVDPSRTDICKPLKPGKDVIYGKFRYRLNANIGTQTKQTMLYGVAAARIKFNPLQGQHASFWLQPDDPTLDTTLGQEVDVIEWFGKGVLNGGLTSFIYAPSRNGQKYGIGNKGWILNPDQYLMNAKDEWYKRYHVFSVEWTPDYYIFRIDGKETGRLLKSAIGGVTASTPEYPILSLLSSDYELGNLPKRDEKNNLPQTMYVDWVKTWQNPTFIPPPPPPPTAPPAP